MKINCSFDELVSVRDLKPNPKNPNVHPEDQIKMLIKQLEFQGQRHPIIVSKRSGFVVVGHGRLEAMIKAGYEKAAVNYQEFESEDQEYAFVVADNSSANWSTLDLSSINDVIVDFGPEFDIDLLAIKGFTIEVAEKLPPGDESKIPELKHCISTKGDVWLLGNHRLMCGDSTMLDDVDKLMNGERAQIAFTSPPYNAGDEVEIGSKGHKYDKHDDGMQSDDYLNLLTDFTTNTLMHSDLSIVNIQQLSGNKIAFIEYLHTFKNNFVDMAIWNKTHGTPCLPKRCMNSAFEYVCFFSNEENPPKTIKTAPMFHGNVNNVYSGQKQTKNEFSEIHRATFPLHLPEYFITTFSTGAVLELFNGVGTTLICCEKLGRKCFSMEIDPLYVDTTVKRWEQFSGMKAKLESTGQTYEELELARR